MEYNKAITFGLSENREVRNWSEVYIVSDEIDKLVVTGISSWIFQTQKFKTVNAIKVADFLEHSMSTGSNSFLVIYICLGSNENSYNDINAILSRRVEGVSLLVMDIFSVLEGIHIKRILTEPNAGILCGNLSGDEVVDYIDGLQKLGWVMSNSLKEQLVDNMDVSKSTESIATSSYSAKEKRILEAAIQGLSLKQTAEAVGISANTVAVYRSKMMKRAGVRSISELIRIVNEN